MRLPLALLVMLLTTGCMTPDLEDTIQYDMADVTMQYPSNWTIAEEVNEGDGILQMVSFASQMEQGMFAVQRFGIDPGTSLDSYADQFISEMGGILEDDYKYMMEYEGLDSKADVEKKWGEESLQGVERRFTMEVLSQELKCVSQFFEIPAPTGTCFIIMFSNDNRWEKDELGFDYMLNSIQFIEGASVGITVTEESIDALLEE